MIQILLIEDDIAITDSLKLYLENSGFWVDVMHTGYKAVENILSGKYQLILLDINLPTKDGISIGKTVRKTSKIPIIMLTANTSENDVLTGLDIGADDYITKPFSPKELISRINAVLRRSIGTVDTDHIIHVNNISIDTQMVQVFINNQEIPLTRIEYEIFLLIVQANGKLITRDMLMKKVIGYENYIFDRTIDTHIKNIRKKCNDKNIILTIRGKGYRLHV